ncbi:MAG: LON peptidase substrate-binding domain-containing protein [Magnetococcales bacterium]|nr:LON peptidase substrate-binding domain-containing protein [Magnetococcales bacterium]
MPLFPLHTVLFPGGTLNLRIFEERYLNLIRHCSHDVCGFIVVLIRQGREVKDIPTLYDIGTLATIVDFGDLPGGLLGITVQGTRRFRIHGVRSRPDGLLLGHGELLPVDAPPPLPQHLAVLDDLLELLAGTNPINIPRNDHSNHQSSAEKGGVEKSRDSAALAWRLGERLQVPNHEKQALLEMHDPLLRLEFIGELLSLSPM